MSFFEKGGPGLLGHFVELHDREAEKLFLACIYGFVIFMAYAMLRPLRDAMALNGEIRHLPWLFTATLLAMLLAHPLYTTLVSRLKTAVFVALTSRFFALNLLIFFGLTLSLDGQAGVWLARAFFVWTSVFNLFILSIFWSFLADVFNRKQARRLFGFIALGVTLGGIAGSFLTATLGTLFDPLFLLPASILLLEIAARVASRLGEVRSHESVGAGGKKEEKIGGGILEGIRALLSTPYLLGIAAFMLFYTVTATFLYFIQAEIVSAALVDRAARTVFFARIDLFVNIFTILIQLFATGRLMHRFGISAALIVLPAVCFPGFILLGFVPTLQVLALFQILRRSVNYGVTRPAREVLYTVVGRAHRYKAKNFIDTFVYRAGDQVGAWSWALLASLCLGISASAWVAAPLALAWCGLGAWLGRRAAAIGELGGDPETDASNDALRILGSRGSTAEKY